MKKIVFTLLAVLMIAFSMENVYAEDEMITVSTKDEYYQNLVSGLKSGKNKMFFVYGKESQGEFLGEKGLVKGLAQYVQGNIEKDNYVIFNIKTIKYKKHIKENGESYFEVEFVSYTDENQEKQLQMLIDRKIKELELESATDYEKIKIVHDYILKEITYDDTQSKFSAYDGLMNQSGVCSSYCLAFQKFMDTLGIPCCCVYYGNHGWNSVYLEGKWYNMDLTWDDTGIDKYEYVWFLQNDDYFKRYHGDYSFCTATQSYEMKDFEYRYEISPVSNTEYQIKVLSKLDDSVVLEGTSAVDAIDVTGGVIVVEEDTQVIDVEEVQEETTEFGIFDTLIFFSIGMGIGGLILWGVLKKTEQQI